MAKLSLPHERRKAKLQARAITLKVGIAERKEQLAAVRTELQAMKPKTKPADDLTRRIR